MRALQQAEEIRLKLSLIAKSQQVVLRIGFLCLFNGETVVVPGKIVYLLISSFYARPLVCIVIKTIIHHKFC